VPRIGYCQSLNFLAGLLLLFLPEEKAFWMLYIMTQTHLPRTHEMNLEGSSVDQWVGCPPSPNFRGTFSNGCTNRYS